jgi:hypothetical protein
MLVPKAKSINSKCYETAISSSPPLIFSPSPLPLFSLSSLVSFYVKYLQQFPLILRENTTAGKSKGKTLNRFRDKLSASAFFRTLKATDS